MPLEEEGGGGVSKPPSLVLALLLPLEIGEDRIDFLLPPPLLPQLRNQPGGGGEERGEKTFSLSSLDSFDFRSIVWMTDHVCTAEDEGWGSAPST